MGTDSLCPIQALSRALGQRWTLQIIYHLRERRRFCELQERVCGINPATLSQRLKFLEEKGLLSRKQVSEAPPHVEYALTEMGEGLLPILDALVVWARRWLAASEDVTTQAS
jgi:DNA-binding HxlR family transcriptional regulator